LASKYSNQEVAETNEVNKKPTKSRSEEADVYTYHGVGQGWRLVDLPRSWTEADVPNRK
jgi:hypothetical protein